MQRIGGKTEDDQTRYHQSLRLETGEWWQSLSDKWYIVTNLGPFDAVDEYGDVHRGFAYTLREANSGELAEHERQRAKRDAKTPEERIESQLDALARMLPGLDWG